MRESDLSSIPGFRSPSVSQEQAPPAAKPTPASTSPGTPILNHLVEEKGVGLSPLAVGTIGGREESSHIDAL